MAVKNLTRSGSWEFGADSCVGIDAKAGFVILRLVWKQKQYHLGREMEGWGVTLCAIQMLIRMALTGPNLDHYKRLVSELTTMVVLGGIAEVADLDH